MLVTLIIIVAFSLLVIFHEFGHYIIAKLLNVKVEKFAVGFGPEWFGFKGKETQYSVNLFPLGGYVRMLGDEVGDPNADSPRSYLAQKWYKRAFIVAFGPVMNFVLAILLFTIIFMVGVNVPDTATTRIGFVYEDTPAFKAGLKEGDIVTKINNQEIKNWDELTKIIQPNYNKNMPLEVLRDNKTIVFQLAPEYDKERKVGILGIRSSQKLERDNPFKAFIKGCEETYSWTEITLKAIWWMVSGKIAPEVSGPVGIAQMISVGVKAGFASLVAFIAVLSINLGVFNLFPIPILDGGHILFLVIEAIKGKPVSAQKIKIAQTIGLAVLLLIFVFATYKDIVRLIIPGPK
ncbi:MAG: RIP metalloprotease RseP [bacterium]|nr:RIP metalloprotease RseP [bacterium]